jgi:hypothetical protein
MNKKMISKLNTAENECRLQLGEFCCALRFNADEKYNESVKYYFEYFLSEKAPDITVYIKIILHQDNTTIDKSLYCDKVICVNNFSFHSGLITGTLDTANKKCVIEVKNILFGNPTVRIFEQFLLQLYYTLLENKYGNAWPEQLLVHSCSILKDGSGYIFTGPSGSGKSTIALLSSAYTVLNDEFSLIMREGDCYNLYATPFNGYCRSKKNMSGPLKKIFILKQDSRHYLNKFRSSDSLIALTREIVPPMGILSAEKNYATSISFNYITRLLEAVPCYELHFLPDENFWACIEELEKKNTSYGTET